VAGCTVGSGVGIAPSAHTRLNPAQAIATTFSVVEESDPTVAAAPDRRVLEQQAEIVRGGGWYKVGEPYQIAGRWYEPKEDPSYDRTGLASWYGPTFHGQVTANGEIFDSTAISAAHPTLPLPSYARVTNLENNRSIVVRINDRGPYEGDRLIDVSEQTAALLGFRRRGLSRVRVQYVSKALLAGEDKATLLATYRGPDPDRPDVLLASAPGRGGPAVAKAVAFAERPGAAAPASEAMKNLTITASAAERIMAAFQVADTVAE
jgi:rare lipoprotein A